MKYVPTNGFLSGLRPHPGLFYAAGLKSLATPSIPLTTAPRRGTLKSEFPGPQVCVCSRTQHRSPSNPLDDIHATHTCVGNLDGPLLSRIDDVPDVDVGIQRPRNEPLIGRVEPQGVDARAVGLEAGLKEGRFGLEGCQGRCGWLVWTNRVPGSRSLHP